MKSQSGGGWNRLKVARDPGAAAAAAGLKKTARKTRGPVPLQLCPCLFGFFLPEDGDETRVKMDSGQPSKEKGPFCPFFAFF